jgi:hypothetical protein
MMEVEVKQEATKKRFKHPCLVVIDADGTILMTSATLLDKPTSYMGDDQFGVDAIVVKSTNGKACWAQGQIVRRLNLEMCSLFNGTVTLRNK